MAKEPRKQVAYNEPRGAYLRVDYKLPIGTFQSRRPGFGDCDFRIMVALVGALDVSVP